MALFLNNVKTLLKGLPENESQNEFRLNKEV